MLNYRLVLTSVLAAGLLLGAGEAASAATDVKMEAIRKLVSEGRHDEAMAGLAAYLKQNPGDAQARFIRGVVLVEQNKTDKAMEEFTKLAVDYPNLPEPYNNLAVLYAARGEYRKARDALLVAIRTHPSYATAHENLGDIYARMAGAAYDKALELDQENKSAKAKLALVDELFSIHRAGVTEASPVQLAVKSNEISQPSTSNSKDTRDDKNVGATLERQVLRVLEAWARAWSSQNANDYLNFYSADFATPRGLTRAQWERLRRKRIKAPRFIEVTVSDPVVEMRGDDLARVKFVQGYRSDVYRDEVSKFIYVRRVGEDWKIISEITDQ